MKYLIAGFIVWLIGWAVGFITDLRNTFPEIHRAAIYYIIGFVTGAIGTALTAYAFVLIR